MLIQGKSASFRLVACLNMHAYPLEVNIPGMQFIRNKGYMHLTVKFLMKK